MKNQHYRITVASLLALMAPMPAMAQQVPPLRDNDTVAVIGDSITEQKLYSVFIADYLAMCRPAQNINTFNVGWSGEKAPAADARLAIDCLTLKPTVATTFYDMNDGGYAAQTPDKQTAYVKAQKSIVDKLKAAGVRTIVLGSPGCVDVDTFNRAGFTADKYNPTLADERDLMAKLAQEEGVPFADVYSLMTDVMTKSKAKYGDKYQFAGVDGIHPNRNGHLVIAYSFLKAMGCDGNIGTITLHLDSNAAEATDGHKILSTAPGSVTIESSRYPFCFYGDPQTPAATSGIIDFFPFNDDLNRFRLVVSGASSPKLKVTWGRASKVFSSDELAKGINLAAEFLDNPFSDVFKRVEGAIASKQTFEVAMTKAGLNSLRGLPTSQPAVDAATAAVVDGYVKAEEALAKNVVDQIRPVRHTIKVETAE